MDSFDTLFEKKQFELIVKATETATDDISLFYRIMSLASLTRLEEAIMCIENNRPTLEKGNMKLLIDMHIELLIMVHDFDVAYKEYEYYKELPYVSQEVEETLRELPKYIRQKEREYYLENSTKVTPDQINKILKGGTEDEIIGILDLLRGYDITPYLDNLVSLLVNYPKQSIRGFTLLLLKYKGVNKEVGYLRGKELLTVNPLKLEAPFETDAFNECKKFLIENEKNITLANNAVQIYSSYLICIYPTILNVETDKLSLVAIRELANKYLNQNTNIEASAKKYQLNYQDILDKMNEIEKYLEDF